MTRPITPERMNNQPHTKGASMKVFKINDYDWYMAPTLREAIAAAMEASGLPEDEATNDPSEVSREELDRLIFVDDNGDRRSFQAELDRRVACGDKAGLFASEIF